MHQFWQQLLFAAVPAVAAAVAEFAEVVAATEFAVAAAHSVGEQAAVQLVHIQAAGQHCCSCIQHSGPLMQFCQLYQLSLNGSLRFL